MNRQIKFRGWDTLGPKMYTGHSLTLQSDGTLVFLDTDGQWKQDENERWVIMQFTGLLDKEGNEIYEGDILQGHNDGLAKVEYWPTSAGYECVFKDGHYIDLSEMCVWFGNQATVIGNIYENSEVLSW